MERRPVTNIEMDEIITGTNHPVDISGIEYKYLNIPYAHQSNSQKLDVYLPDLSSTKSYPVIMFVHGGGFNRGDKRGHHLTVFIEGLKRGYAVVGVNYRLTPEAPFPAQILDVKAAIRWVYANAQEFNFDTNRIAVGGESAGGYLTLMAALTKDIPFFEDKTMGNGEYEPKIHAAIDLYGPTNLETGEAQLIENGLERFTSLDGVDIRALMFNRGDWKDQKELLRFYSPVTYAKLAQCPILLQYGKKDRLVAYQQGIEMFEKLEKNSELDLIEGADHGDPLFETEENIERIYSFLNKNLNL